MFDKAKQLYQAQKMAKDIKKELKNTQIEAEVDGLVFVIDGEQEALELKFPEGETDLKKLAEMTIKAFNKGIKKSQQIAAERMKPLLSGLNMPDLNQ